ncbi:MAG TPA: hypothetical protein VLQ76_01450 [Bacteroidales bacterium]|nr:hypothetical protein [Bacteroidales bacterium]
MKKTSLLILLFTLTLSTYCQTDSSEVSYVAYWSVGDSYDFKVTKTNMQWSGDSLTKNNMSEYVANFEVIDSTETSYTIIWSFKNELVNTYDIPEPLIEKLSKYSVTEVIYTTSELGEFTGIKNWKELGETMRAMFTDLFTVISEEQGSDYDKLMKTAEPIIAIYSSQQGVEQMVLPELQLFHFPFGAMFTVSDTIDYEDQFPNMLGGDPIRAETKLYFESVDYADDRAMLVQESKLNSDDTRALLTRLLTQMVQNDSEFEAALARARYDIRTSTHYDYYYYPGIPIKIDLNRNTVIDIDDSKTRRVDNITIELL